MYLKDNSRLAHAAHANKSICARLSEHWKHHQIKLGNLLVIYNVLLLFAILFFNIFLLYALKKTNQISRRSNLIVVSLCVTDLAIGIFAEPLHLFRIYKDSCLLSKVNGGISALLTNNSVLSVYLLSAFRYFSIKGGLSGKKISKQCISIMIGMSWSASLTASILHTFIITKLAYFGFVTSAYVICTILFVYFYSSVLYMAHKSSKFARDAQVNPTQSRKNVSKTAKTVVALFSAMFVCYTPIIVLGDYRAVLKDKRISHEKEAIMSTAFHWSLTLVYTNSAFNACLFVYKNSKVWTLFKETFFI